MSTSTYAKGWYYRYDYSYAMDYCNNDVASVHAYSLGSCYLDPSTGRYTNVTCDSYNAYIKSYGTASCTGGYTTATQPLGCEGFLHALFGCTPNTDWTTVVPTNGVFGLQQYFPSSQDCDDMTLADHANTTALYFSGKINDTCVPTFVDTSTRLVFPVDYTYSSSDSCTDGYTPKTWPTTCTATSGNEFYKAFTVDFTVPTANPTLAPTLFPNDDNGSSGDSLSTTYIAVIAVGGGAAVLAVLAVVYYFWCKGAAKKEPLLDAYTSA